MFYLPCLIEKEAKGNCVLVTYREYIFMFYKQLFLREVFNRKQGKYAYRFHTEKALSSFAYEFLSDSTHAPIKGYV